MDAVKQENSTNDKAYQRVTPSLRVLTYGKQWAGLLQKHNYSKPSPDFLLLPMHQQGFCLSEAAFNEVRPEKTPREFLQILQDQSAQASVWVAKLNFYVSIAHVVLVDTEFLDTAFGHEILRNAFARGIPAYAVGVATPTSLLAPAYIRGVQYPQSVEEMRDFILSVYQQTRQEKDLVGKS